ncbi:hypothetical protein V9T40_007209 [Parthenolecanium corni]|uniref:Intraflagellar transport protein 122 homolog n=1 Tax=Parthenolecanium corni TaxID=536013 RepID=A0AAN9TVX8_9HEMI
MRTEPAWKEKIRDANKTEQCIYDLSFHPDGSQLIVTAGPAILAYNCTNGSVIRTLTGHKDNVYCLSYCLDGTKFASGGADKTVIIWTSKLEALLKYPHSDAVQCLAFNPVTNVLASCAITDFSFWSLGQKSIQKFKINSRINCCSWNYDGQYLALGLANGNVSIRNSLGDEKFLIDRENSAPGPPIWALAFSPLWDDNEVLCITDWSQKMMFYSMDTKEISKEKNIGFEALTISYMLNGDFILAAGCSKQCHLMSADGVKLVTIGDMQDSWIWCCKANPTSPFIAFGCQDGTIAYIQLIFSTVHDLYQEKYAYRERMTDVIVQNLITNEKILLKCRDWIRKVAVYKNRLAILLPSKVVVYELNSKESSQMHYQIKAKLNKSFDCSLLVVCNEHLIFCLDNKLMCYTFDNKIVGQWIMDDVVKYMKVVGGSPGQEGLIVGLENGEVLKVYLNNPFPTLLLKSNAAIVCADLSLSKRKLAIVDENKECFVYDVALEEIIYQENDATSVAWNSQFEDMLCFSGNEVLNIKIGNCPANQIKFSGIVVGVYGSKVFSLDGSNVITVDIPLSAPLYQCLEKQYFDEAYAVACLGVTENDWKALAHAALEGFELHIAIKAFSKIRSLQHLDLIYDFLDDPHRSKESFMGDVLAYEGRFKEASKFYQKADEGHRALAMYTDMRMFDLAQDFVKSESSNDKKSLIRKKAEWAKNINDPKAAAEMYLSAGEVVKAVDIAIENRWLDMLLELAHRLDSSEVEALKKIANCLNQSDEIESAIEIYDKAGEYEKILRLYVETQNWPAAFALVEKHPQYESFVFLSHAQYLIENDKFVEAQKAFHKAGKPDEATKVLLMLTENAIEEGRFDDAGYYHWILSRQFLDLAKMAEQRREELIHKFYHHDKLANIYFTYHVIHKYLEEPFTSYQPEALFNIARYLLNETKNMRPKGVAQFAILYSLAKQAKGLGGFKIARQALESLQNLRIPAHFQEFVNMATVLIKAKPYHDNEELLIMCYRCSSYNPLVISSATTGGNFCMKCKQPFVFSFVTFEVLPLIEFQLEEGISDAEALKLLQSTDEEFDRPTEEINSNFQTLLINDVSQNKTDLFTDALINLETDKDKFCPVIVNRETLLSMDSSLVLICERPQPLRFQYYRNLVPELQIIACSSCYRVFHVDDYEMEVLQKGHCPFCRVAPENHQEATTNE